MAQCAAGEHDQWRGYMTVLAINHGIMESVSILTVLIRLMIKYDVDTLWNCFRKEMK